MIQIIYKLYTNYIQNNYTNYIQIEYILYTNMIQTLIQIRYKIYIQIIYKYDTNKIQMFYTNMIQAWYKLKIIQIRYKNHNLYLICMWLQCGFVCLDLETEPVQQHV